MSVTLKEIARHTGLSLPTVGNVLGRAAGRYSEETRRRVLSAARELGYRPNASARAMRQGRLGSAALVLSRSKQSTHSHIPAGLLDGLDNALARHDMHLSVSRLSDEELTRGDFIPKVLRQYMADGMIVNYTHDIPPAMLDLIHAHHTPAVWLNARLPHDCVHPDDLTAARAATEQLLHLGHRRIAFLHLIPSTYFAAPFEAAWPRFHYSVHDRQAGYLAALAAASLPPRIAHHDRYVDEPDHLAACRALLSTPDRPTAVLAYSERDVSALLCAAAQLGLSVPRDLSLLTFAPAPPWEGGLWVSAIPIPTAEMGRRAVDMLLQKIKSPDGARAPEVVPYGPVTGATLAPPPPPTES